MTMTEQELEQAFIGKLTDLKYTHRQDIRDRAALESNFRNHFQALNRVQLTDTKGRTVLVPVDKIAYVDLGQEHVRPVGFGTL